MKNELFVVTACRYGDTRSHSYVIGVFQKKSAAVKAADKETVDRGGKYGCVVESFTLDHYYQDILDSPKVIYKTKSSFES